MWKEVYSRRQETFANVLGADKDKVRRNQTLGDNYKDAMFDCKSGFLQSEDFNVYGGL